MAHSQDREPRIVLLARTGSGQSATANTLLGKNVFECKIAAHAVTTTCRAASRDWRGRRLLVVNTPGLFDTKETLDTTCTEIGRCVLASVLEPYAIVLVLRLDTRYTEEEKKTVGLIKTIFGESAMQHRMILFSHKDNLGNHSLSVFIAESHVILRSLIQECGSHCCAFSNRAGEAEQEVQVQELVGLIDQIVQSNGGLCFSDAAHKNIEEKLTQKEAILKKSICDQLKNEIRPVEEEDAAKRGKEGKGKLHCSGSNLKSNK